ncbi:MAG: NAD-dependent epimerase/dehydratase family protein [Clostridia bacterium]|nr:NAD-dependent epimerase/dehydratase family protein [Clostridia bacterium]MBQ7789574.1 NAD-dependent epimerase/dehydratase family protein [Clostridia bacterium]
MISNPLYLEDIEYIASRKIAWDKLKNSTIMISGAGGLIGSLVIDAIMYKNKQEGLNCTVLALGRSKERAKEKFSSYWELDTFSFIEQDINKPLDNEKTPKADYIVHLASNTHPLQYSTDPIGTINTNIIGTANLLEFASYSSSKRVLFASSNEIYGENRGDVELFDEHYCGYIDSNTLRAGYPESKRCGEAMCQAYIKQKGLDVVIARLTRSYGPTMLMSDSKAISQFIKKGIAGENIVLKSEGNQYYSYTYVSDAVCGLLTVLLNGECGQAYNIADQKSDIRLKDLAKIISDFSGTKVVFELPDETERAGYSTATVARLDGSKIRKIGWEAKYDIKSGLERTLSILKAQQN